MKPPSSRLYSLLPPLVRPVSTFSTLLPRTWVGRSTRRFTRRSSSSAPRKMTRCVYPVYCCNISTCLIFFQNSPSYHWNTYGKRESLQFLVGGFVVSFRPVYLLSADPRKEHLASETTPSRVPRASRPSQCASAAVAAGTSDCEWHRGCEWIPSYPQWTGSGRDRSWPRPRGSTSHAKRSHDA